jgi:ribosomal protein S27E
MWFPLTLVAMNIFRNILYIKIVFMEEAHGKECRGEPIAMLRTSPARTHPTLSTGEAVYYPAFKASLEEQEQNLPSYIQREFDDFLHCGRLEYGFLRVRCEDCHHERLVAFSCKRRGFCPSCGARRMAESAALLVDLVLFESHFGRAHHQTGQYIYLQLPLELSLARQLEKICTNFIASGIADLEQLHWFKGFL